MSLKITAIMCITALIIFCTVMFKCVLDGDSNIENNRPASSVEIKASGVVGRSEYKIVEVNGVKYFISGENGKIDFKRMD